MALVYNSMKIYLASDHAGFGMKEKVKEYFLLGSICVIGIGLTFAQGLPTQGNNSKVTQCEATARGKYSPIDKSTYNKGISKVDFENPSKKANDSFFQSENAGVKVKNGDSFQSKDGEIRPISIGGPRVCCTKTIQVGSIRRCSETDNKKVKNLGALKGGKKGGNVSQ